MRTLGRFDCKIVGMQWHAGSVLLGSRVVLQRDTDNSHDPNAIRAVNDDDELIGFLPRSVAEWLAPLVDHGHVRLEAIVPANGVNSLPERIFSMPLEITIRLTDTGESLLAPNRSPKNDLEAIHEIVRWSYARLAEWTNAKVNRAVGRRLSALVEGPSFPATRMLVALAKSFDRNATAADSPVPGGRQRPPEAPH